MIRWRLVDLFLVQGHIAGTSGSAVEAPVHTLAMRLPLCNPPQVLSEIQPSSLKPFHDALHFLIKKAQWE